jgi:hypothetical protein
VDRAGQVGGYSSHTTNIAGSLDDSSRPWNKNTLKTQLARKKNPSQNLAKQLQTYQDLTSNNTTKRHTDQAITQGKSHKRLTSVRSVRSTGQTGHAWAAQDEQHQRVNSTKSNSR